MSKFQNDFSKKEKFTRQELFNYYKKLEPELNENTFRWRIHNLKNKKQITIITKNLFSLSFKPIFKPTISKLEKKLSHLITIEFSQLNYCIWSTKFIHEFMLHIPNKILTIIQVERNAILPVYNSLRSHKYKNLFMNPEKNEIEKYINILESAIIILPLITKSPIQTVNNLKTATVEKLIVDLYCDKKLLEAFQGSELIYIVNNAFSKYQVDFTKLQHYAKRRNKSKQILELIQKITEIPKEVFND